MRDTRYEIRDTNSAFTLVEILIVVAILGILAAITIPQFQSYTQQAKESAAKSNLRILREAIERYATRNNGIAPGYPVNDTSLNPTYMRFSLQLVTNGNYLSERPKNPFNDKNIVKIIGNSEAFPAGPVSTELFGWVYKPATKTIRLNWTGTDSQGISYFDY